MERSIKEIIAQCAQSSYAGTTSFGEIVGLLHQAGVESYFADYRRVDTTYYLPDGTMVNEYLVQHGYAFYYPYFPYTKSAQFQKDEQAAMASKLGLWGACHPTASDDGGYKMDETAAQAGS